MEFTDEKKKQIVREAVRIIHDTCTEEKTCRTCPFRDKYGHCVFDETPFRWPLSNKTPATDWNYFKECEEEKDE